MTPGELRILFRLLERIAISLEKIVDDKPKQLKMDLQDKWPREETKPIPLKHSKIFTKHHPKR